jgi:hypothetical protein
MIASNCHGVFIPFESRNCRCRWHDEVVIKSIQDATSNPFARVLRLSSSTDHKHWHVSVGEQAFISLKFANVGIIATGWLTICYAGEIFRISVTGKSIEEGRAGTGPPRKGK